MSFKEYRITATFEVPEGTLTIESEVDSRFGVDSLVMIYERADATKINVYSRKIGKWKQIR